jgi:hypothetical protein
MAKTVEEKLNEALGIAKEVLAETAMELPDELKQMQEVSKDLQTTPSEDSFVRIPRFKPTEIAETYDSDLENDYHHAREVLKRLVFNAEMTLDALLCVAQDSQHPRAYEVAGLLMKTIGEATKDLIGLQKTLREIRNADNTSSLNVEKADSVTTNNFVFNGTTAELQKIIREQMGRNT